MDTIVLSKPDLARLRALLRPAAGSSDSELLDLEEELERATIVEAQALPTDVVAMDSTVTVVDVETQQRETFTLVVPAHADVSRGRISVIAPLGTALLGYRVGDVVTWRMPGGVRRLRIDVVEHHVTAAEA